MKPTSFSFGIISVTHISVRSNPDHKSELLTQLLFGETFSILNRWNDWLNIRVHPSNLEGWIPDQSYIPSATGGKAPGEGETFVNLQPILVSQESHPKYPIVVLPGSTLPIKAETGKTFKLENQTYRFESPVPEPLDITEDNRMEALSLIFINTPFLYGGRSTYGIDGTGLIQLVYKMYGIPVPWKIEDIVQVGKAIPFAHDSMPGDLAFFENKEGEIIHTGIITHPGKIIHCHGLVREDPIDHAGIYGIEEEKYLFYLRIINRILPG